MCFSANAYVSDFPSNFIEILNPITAAEIKITLLSICTEMNNKSHIFRISNNNLVNRVAIIHQLLTTAN